MSAEALRAILERVKSDGAFAESLREDPIGTLTEYDLSTVEAFALACGDSNALRRLQSNSASEVSDFDRRPFRRVALVAFDEEMAAAFGDAVPLEAGAKTTEVTSAGVTKCCWTDPPV
jgi:hypothetical protein